MHFQLEMTPSERVYNTQEVDIRSVSTRNKIRMNRGEELKLEKKVWCLPRSLLKLVEQANRLRNKFLRPPTPLAIS
jgi:hypothetical protein